MVHYFDLLSDLPKLNHHFRVLCAWLLQTEFDIQTLIRLDLVDSNPQLRLNLTPPWPSSGRFQLNVVESQFRRFFREIEGEYKSKYQTAHKLYYQHLIRLKWSSGLFHFTKRLFKSFLTTEKLFTVFFACGYRQPGAFGDELANRSIELEMVIA